MTGNRPRDHRVLLVTFDLFETVPGDPRYNMADAALKFHGPVFRPVKQLRLLITRSSSNRVKASIEQRIGRQTTIMIAPIKSIPSWRIHGAAKRREWRHFIKALDTYNVQISHVTGDADSSLSDATGPHSTGR